MTTQGRDRFKMALHTRILWGLILGVLSGLAAHKICGDESVPLGNFIRNVTEPVGQLFLRLLLMVVVPLIFSSLVLSIVNLKSLKTFGRLGLRSFVACLVISTISVAIGLGLANTIKPGTRINPELATRLQTRFAAETEKQVTQIKAATTVETPMARLVKTLVPSNIFSSLASDPPNLIHIMFFAVAFGSALMLLSPEQSKPLVQCFEAISMLCGKLVNGIMWLAPFAVVALVFNNTARYGAELLLALGWFVVTVLIGLCLHMFGVYSIVLRVFAGTNPLDFFKRIKVVILTAFSTSSSTATLPTTLKASEENLKIPKKIGDFVLTVGATANQNGTALYEGVTVLFLAQLAGVPLSFADQIGIAYLAILASLGTAGVPSGSIPFIALVLSSYNINPAYIAIILGVDRFLDMCRTTVNVAGDLVVASYVASKEGDSNAT